MDVLLVFGVALAAIGLKALATQKCQKCGELRMRWETRHRYCRDQLRCHRDYQRRIRQSV